MNKFNYILAFLSFIVSVIFGFVGLFLPPPGELSTSLLFLILQFLLFCASLIGVNSVFVFNLKKLKDIINNEKN